MSTFKAEDLKESGILRKLLEEIANDPILAGHFPECELLPIKNLVSTYETDIKSTTLVKYTCLSYTNLRQEYIKKMSDVITSLIKFLRLRMDAYAFLVHSTMDEIAAAEKKVIATQKKLDDNIAIMAAKKIVIATQKNLVDVQKNLVDELELLKI